MTAYFINKTGVRATSVSFAHAEVRGLVRGGCMSARLHAPYIPLSASRSSNFFTPPADVGATESRHLARWTQSSTFARGLLFHVSTTHLQTTGSRSLKLELIDGKKRVFSDGSQTLELYDIGPNPHAREMLVAYLPKQGILFQGDMFFSPFEGQVLGFAQEATQHFAAKIRELGFTVNTLAGVHGKVGTMSELEQSLELAKRMQTGTMDHQPK